MADRRKWMVLVVAAVCLGQVAASGGSAPASDIVQRSRRYPLHLDPLYQYRFLARSRRESFVVPTLRWSTVFQPSLT